MVKYLLHEKYAKEEEKQIGIPRMCVSFFKEISGNSYSKYVSSCKIAKISEISKFKD